jgi:hypothetical protein
VYVKELAANDQEKYNGLSKSHGSVFDSLQWNQIFGEDITHYGIYDGDNIIGGFVGYKVKKFGIPFHRNPPLTPSIGPFFKITSVQPVHIMEKHKQIMAAMAEFLDKEKYPIVSISLNRNVTDMQPFIWRHFKVVPEYTYIMDLSMSGDEIWKRMSSETRNHITKGTKDGLTVKKTDDYAIVKSLITKTYDRQNKKVDYFYTNKVLFDFANKDNSFAYVALQNNRPIACTFCIYDNKTAYYLLSGYDAEIKHHGAGALCVWESIKHAKSIGLTFFDFEGSMVPNIERYFRGFGAELKPYYRINKAMLPLEIVLKFVKREFF